jgi:hypothetical protein
MFAALRSAGFEVVVECDLRGWMYWYKPFMSLAWPITIWIPSTQHDDALAYIGAPVQSSADEDVPHLGFWARAREARGPISAACLVLMFFIGF